MGQESRGEFPFRSPARKCPFVVRKYEGWGPKRGGVLSNKKVTDLAEASGVSLPSIKRLETQPGPLSAQERTLTELRRAIERAGVEFIPENGGGVGVRLSKRGRKK
jgi:hypothetical protein